VCPNEEDASVNDEIRLKLKLNLKRMRKEEGGRRTVLDRKSCKEQ
jgi:hypothetical protein